MARIKAQYFNVTEVRLKFVVRKKRKMATEKESAACNPGDIN